MADTEARAVGVVTTIMHDTVDLAAAVAFWSEVLGLDVVHREGSFVYLGRLAGDVGPRLAFQQVPEARAEKNRLHLDIRVPDRRSFEARVVELGGSRVGEHHDPGFPAWTVMADPEGNQFCIYEQQD